MCVLPASPAHANQIIRGKIAEIVEAEAQYDLFSGTVLVAKDGKIIYAE